jgi:HSP20 family protein
MSEQSTETGSPVNGQNISLARWDPIDIFESLQDDMDRFWRRLAPEFRLTPRSRFRRGSGPGTAWAPRIDVYEQDNAMIVKAELPGVKKEDVQVELADGILVIRGESKTETDTKGEQYYRVERSVGSFYRRLPLPFEVNADQIEATLTDGVLEVRVSRPANMKTEPQQIPIS